MAFHMDIPRICTLCSCPKSIYNCSHPNSRLLPEDLDKLRLIGTHFLVNELQVNPSLQ
jgi:hypothetical protein